VFRASGEEARTIEAVLREPKRLVRYLEERAATGAGVERRASRAVPTVSRVQEGNLAGFALDLAREDGSRAAHAIVLGRRSGDALRFVIAIGEDEAAIRALAREVASKLK
jgi:hypothetical protein